MHRQRPRVARGRPHSSSASSESLARYLSLHTATAPAKRGLLLSFFFALVLYVLLPLFTFAPDVHFTS